MSTNVGEIDLSLVLNSDKFNTQLKNVDSQANKASSTISSSLSKIGKAVAVAFSVTKVIQFGKECLNVATETSNAWIGLNSILTGQGKSFERAKSFINDYISDGLVPLSNAVTSYKNLAARGYSSEQIEKTMTALKNSATFGRQSTYSLGEAVQTASEGLKDENSILVDNAGVTKNVAKMWEDYAKSIGKTTNNLTQEEKIQAEVNGILEETKYQSNDAAIYANTYSGKVAQLSQAFTTMKTAIGNVIQPIAKLFIPFVTTAVNAVTKLFTALSGLMSLFGLKADSVETVSSGIEGLANSAENASDAVSDVSDSASEAGDSAKKASNNLAAFDNLNVLPKDTDSSSGSSSGGSSGGSSGLTDTLDVASTVTEDTTAFDGLISRVKELADIFKSGFNISFGDTNFDGILTHLGNIKDTLIEIWTDPEVLGAANNWVNTLVYTLGQVTGSVARIGINIAEGLVGSIDNYLSQNKDRIKNFIVTMFNISSEDLALTGNFWQALGEISDVFSSDTAKQIGADIIAMFSNPFMSAIELCSKFVLDVKAILLQPIIDNAEKIKTTIENVMKPIQTFTGTLAEAFTYVGDKWNEVYDTHIHPLMESLKTGLSDTFGKFLDVYNTYVVPALQGMADKFNDLWNTHLKPFVDKVGELVGSIADAITALWEGVLKPVVDWIVQNIIPVLVPIFEGIWNTISSIFGAIADTVGGVIETFQRIIDFLVGVFTGDWDKVWSGISETINGIVDLFKGLWSWITEPLKEFVQGVIDFFTNLWDTLVGHSIVPDTINAIIEWFKELPSKVVQIVKEFINSVITFFTDLWNRVVKIVTTMMNSIKTKISTVFTSIKTTIQTIINSIKSTISTVFNSIKSTISTIITTIQSKITTAFTTIKTKLSTIMTSIKTTMSNIWNGIWTTIKNVINKILSGIESFANGIVRGINKVLSALDGVVNAVGKVIGIDISVPKLSEISLPRLAQGGYVKANTPQLAVIGDNKTQGEVVAPEDKMLEMILTALKMFNEQNQTQLNKNSQLIQIVLKFTGSLSQLARILKPELDDEDKRRGVKLIIGGDES